MLSLRLRLIEIDHICRSVGESIIGLRVIVRAKLELLLQASQSRCVTLIH